MTVITISTRLSQLEQRLFHAENLQASRLEQLELAVVELEDANKLLAEAMAAIDKELGP